VRRETLQITNLGETSHVVPADVRVGTVEFFDDDETLVQLSEHVSHRATEQRVLRRVLKLTTGSKRI